MDTESHFCIFTVFQYKPCITVLLNMILVDEGFSM